MKFTQVPTNTFETIQLNAGILLSDFDPNNATVDVSDIIGATSGGISFEATPSYVDFGEDIDNVPANTKELKRIDSWEAILSGTFVTISEDMIKLLVGATDANVADDDFAKITPSADLSIDDFDDIWWVGDYSADNTDETGGFLAIKLLNSLSTGGFKIKSEDKAKGNFDFEFTGHYSMSNMDQVPFEVYIREVSASSSGTGGSGTGGSGTSGTGN